MSLGRMWSQFVKALFSPFSSWWAGQKARHFTLLGGFSFFGLAGLIWSIIYFLFMGGASIAAWETQTSITWVILLVSSVMLFFAGPEFIHYQGQYSALRDVLNSDSVSEIRKSRREAEEAAKLLGPIWEARLRAHFIDMGIVRGRGAPEVASESTAEDFYINWWGAEHSRLTSIIPLGGGLNRLVIFGTISGMILQVINMLHGIATSHNGLRENTLHLLEFVQGASPGSYASPYFADPLGWGVLAFGLLLCWVTQPVDAPSAPAPEAVEEE